MRYIYIYYLILTLTFIMPSLVFAQNMVIPEGVWSYDDDYTGQEDWAAVKQYEICGQGTRQSPINITYTKQTSLPLLNFKYRSAEGSLRLVPNRFFGFDAINGGTLIAGDEPYSLYAIEIHSPSSHRIKDGFYPGEIHFIHKNTKSDILIVAVFIDIGADNPAIAEMIKHIADKKPTKFTINIESLISDKQSYYAYEGSLPYPPCSENVHWKIMKKPITISNSQLASITRIIGRNSRLPQPVYIREVLESNP